MATEFSDHDDDMHTAHDESDELNEHVHEPGDPDGLVAAEERERWRETHPAPPATPSAIYKPKRHWPAVLITLAVIAAAVGGSYWFGTHMASKNQQPKHTATNTPQTHHTTTPVATTTKQYTSTIYGLSFDYPKTWTVSDTAAKLTVTSPDMQLTSSTGKKVTAQVVVTMQNPQPSIAGFPADGAIAALASEKMSYKQPSSIQRAQTYVSYLGYSDASGVDALYITGDFGYQQSQLVPMSDVIKGNPLISASFIHCKDEHCTASDPVTVQASGWLASAANKDIDNLLESIVLQGS